MSRLPPALARRLDRLARRAHRFHRFAHHPLCGAYAGEVLRLGRRTRLCRGCTLAAAGAVAGVLAGAAARPPGPELLLLGPALLTAWAALALAPRGGRPRSKVLTRAGPLALAGFLLASGLRAAAAAGPGDWSGGCTAAVTTALVALGALAWRRRGPDRAACAGCPQAPPGPRCDGLREVARRERAFSRLASRWIDRDRAGSCETAPP
jgi:hypothetical protein